MSRKVILEAPVGGLGDGLLFSTLPELFDRNGDRVYISSKTKCRNPEVHSLLYNANPFICGVADEGDFRIGYVHDKSFFLAARRFPNPIRAIEFLHGFSLDARRMLGFAGHDDRPKVYYGPRFLPEWSERIAIDPRSISQGFPSDVFEGFVLRLGFDEEKFVLDSAHAGGNGASTLPGLPRYHVSNIREYMDIIYSCKAFVCTESGGSSLASALRADNTFALCTTMHMNSRLYVWPNVNYTVTGSLSGDYLWNDLSAENVGQL